MQINALCINATRPNIVAKLMPKLSLMTWLSALCKADLIKALWRSTNHVFDAAPYYIWESFGRTLPNHQPLFPSCQSRRLRRVFSCLQKRWPTPEKCHRADPLWICSGLYACRPAYAAIDEMQHWDSMSTSQAKFQTIVIKHKVELYVFVAT